MEKILGSVFILMLLLTLLAVGVVALVRLIFIGMVDESEREFLNNRERHEQAMKSLHLPNKKQGGFVSGEFVLFMWGVGLLFFLGGWVREHYRILNPSALQTIATVWFGVALLAVAMFCTLCFGFIEVLG